MGWKKDIKKIIVNLWKIFLEVIEPNLIHMYEKTPPHSVKLNTII